MGIDTDQLNGEGFELLVHKGDTVRRPAGRKVEPRRGRGSRQVPQSAR
jgi:hypothetical protein